MSRKLKIEIEAEEHDGKTEITMFCDGAVRGADLATIILKLGKSFGVTPEVWFDIGVAGAAGKTAIGGTITREISIGGHRNIKEDS